MTSASPLKTKTAEPLQFTPPPEQIKAARRKRKKANRPKSITTIKSRIQPIHWTKFLVNSLKIITTMKTISANPLKTNLANSLKFFTTMKTKPVNPLKTKSGNLPKFIATSTIHHSLPPPPPPPPPP